MALLRQDDGGCLINFVESALSAYREEADVDAELVRTPEERIPQDHPLRAVKTLVEEALAELSPVFDAMNSQRGRHSIPPGRLLKATLLMALH